jgi:hypothetical protein
MFGVLQNGAFNIFDYIEQAIRQDISHSLTNSLKIISLEEKLQNIIIDFEGLRDFSSNDCGSLDSNGGAQFKKCRMRNSVTASAKQTRDLFCGVFHSRAGAVP